MERSTLLCSTKRYGVPIVPYQAIYLFLDHLVCCGCQDVDLGVQNNTIAAHFFIRTFVNGCGVLRFPFL